jgi:hypothetical protein
MTLLYKNVEIDTAFSNVVCFFISLNKDEVCYIINNLDFIKDHMSHLWCMVIFFFKLPFEYNNITLID